MSQESFFLNKICSCFICKKLMKNGVKIFKKISNTWDLQKNAFCFDSSKTIIFIFFYSRGIFWAIPWLPQFLLHNYTEASSINTLNNQKYSFCNAHYRAYYCFKVLHFYKLFQQKLFENIEHCKFYEFWLQFCFIC